jgi:L-threonylcarbamoyladenylate synthase
MQTELAPWTAINVLRAAELLRAGELVAFPTETVYGLGARADSAPAVRRIFAAKGRPEGRPLILHLGRVEDALDLVRHWPEQAERLARHFWPGPLTLVLERSAAVIDEVVAGGRTVALRMPAHPAAIELLARCAFPLAAPSANLFGAAPPRSGAEVLAGLGGRIPFVLDAGRIDQRELVGELECDEELVAASGRAASEPALGSTILDLTRRPAVVLRHGALPVSELAEVVELA